jgi:hypothetical protein
MLDSSKKMKQMVQGGDPLLERLKKGKPVRVRVSALMSFGALKTLLDAFFPRGCKADELNLAVCLAFREKYPDEARRERREIR